MQIRTTNVVLGLLAASLLVSPSLLAQEGSADAGSMAAIEKEYDAASSKWMESYRAASKDERTRLMAERPTPEKWMPRVRAILDASAASEDGCAAAVWIVRVARASGDDLGHALDVMAAHHLDSDQLGDLMSSLSRNPSPMVGRFLDKAEAAAKGEMLAKTCFAMASHLKSAASTANTLKDATAEDKERYAGYYGKEAVDVLSVADAAALEKRAASYFERILADEGMSAVPHYRETLGAAAKNNLFELRNLSIGKVAPDIVGEDIDGTPMKLSDYRGKVVVLDFWGDW
jgi:hypothetical protein